MLSPEETVYSLSYDHGECPSRVRCHPLLQELVLGHLKSYFHFFIVDAVKLSIILFINASAIWNADKLHQIYDKVRKVILKLDPTDTLSVVAGGKW